MRGVTCRQKAQIAFKLFQPALPMRGVTKPVCANHYLIQISTRTPHAGSDIINFQLSILGFISTRTPHAGSDMPRRHPRTCALFQPALPMRGVTSQQYNGEGLY